MEENVLSEQELKQNIITQKTGEGQFVTTDTAGDYSLFGPPKGAIKKVTKTEPELSTSGGTSDARFISKICPVIEFGIVGKTMHQINENISVTDIEKLSEIYFLFLKNIFKDKF